MNPVKKLWKDLPLFSEVEKFIIAQTESRGFPLSEAEAVLIEKLYKRIILLRDSLEDLHDFDSLKLLLGLPLLDLPHSADGIVGTTGQVMMIIDEKPVWATPDGTFVANVDPNDNLLKNGIWSPHHE